MEVEMNGVESTPQLALGFGHGEDSLQSYIVHDDAPERATIEKLSENEKLTLLRLEEEIDRDLDVFWGIAGNLLQIKTGKLYRETHKTFESYCQERWNMTRVHANRLIKFQQCTENLESEPTGSVAIPSTESQARVIANLDADEQKAVARAVKTRFGEKATATEWKATKEKVYPSYPTADDAKSPAYKKKIVPLPQAVVALTPMAANLALAKLLNQLEAMAANPEHEAIRVVVQEAKKVNASQAEILRRKEAA